MATNVTPAAQVIFGVKMAIALGPQYPNISAALVESDFEHDPAPLINVLHLRAVAGSKVSEIESPSDTRKWQSGDFYQGWRSACYLGADEAGGLKRRHI